LSLIRCSPIQCLRMRLAFAASHCALYWRGMSNTPGELAMGEASGIGRVFYDVGCP
jgi:hypothetical protein